MAGKHAQTGDFIWFNFQVHKILKMGTDTSGEWYMLDWVGPWDEDRWDTEVYPDIFRKGDPGFFEYPPKAL